MTHEILTEFVEGFVTVEIKVMASNDPFSMIYAANEVMANQYANAPGLMRCLMHFDEEESKFSNIFRAVTLDWHKKIAISMHRQFPDIPVDEHTLLMVAYALGGMVDNFLFERFVERNPALVEAFPDSASAAHFLAIMWYRAVYLKNPASDQLGKFGSFKLLAAKKKI